MRKLFCTLVILLAAVTLSSCRHAEEYQLLHLTGEISSVSIATVSFDENGRLSCEDKLTIADVDAFMHDFRSIECYTYYGDPIGISVEHAGADVIRITYLNGDYELICWNGQAEYAPARGLRNYVGYSTFDQTQFECLIEKLLAQE